MNADSPRENNLCKSVASASSVFYQDFSDRLLESELEAVIQKELIKIGWAKEDILVEVYLNHDGRRLRPDMILLYNLYPLAILEVKSPSKHLGDATRQGLLYADSVPDKKVNQG
jgi:hypothetical protein